MCINPVSIPNPYIKRKVYRQEMGQLVETDPRLYNHAPFVEVPCGKCAECRNTYHNSILQRCLVEAQSSYLYFVTLTYDNKHVPSLVLPTGQRIFYSDYTHVQHMFKRLRANNVIDRDFRYICVTDYGTAKNRPHFHLLIFVSKKSGDTPATPFHYENLFFTHLQIYFAENVGTRKHPVYEKLFTYAIRRTSAGVKTNYFVKYVSLQRDFCHTIQDSTTLVKTVRYLIGYMNKSSKFDEFVDKLLSIYRDTDPILFNKLSRLLRTTVHYSKGLGFGFDNGVKLSLQPISRSCSLNVSVYTELKKTLPKRFEDFQLSYPELAESVLDYMWHNCMREYDSLEDYLDTLDTRGFYLHCISLIYFPKNMARLIRELYYNTHISTPTVSYFYAFIHPTAGYKMPTKLSYTPITESYVYKYIRKGVDEGISHHVPYLAFILPGSQPTYLPLCSFYKRYATTQEDTLAMYKSCGVKNFVEWQELFSKYMADSVKKACISKSNDFRNSLSEENICISQNSCLTLFTAKELFTILFTNS